MPKQTVRTVALRSVVFTSDATCVLFSLWGAFQLRYGFQPPTGEMGWGVVLDFFSGQGIPPLLLGALFPGQLALFLREGIYRGLWRFASVPDLIRIVRTSVLGAILLGTLVFFFQIDRVPPSIMVLYPLLLIMGLGGTRLAYRWMKDSRFSLANPGKEPAQILIIGAGRAGETVIRDTLRYPDYHVVGLLDNDPKKQGSEIQGIRVLGLVNALEKTLASHQIDTVFLTVDSPSRQLIEDVLTTCSRLQVECRIVPSWRELVNGQVDLQQMRPATVEDLLGRDPVDLDMETIARSLVGQVVLITGGGGSIGSEVCRQVARQRPSQLVVLDHGEYNLYQIERELRLEFPSLTIHAILGDVKNVDLLHRLFTTYHPQVVIHAAAYKHVPMLENNSAEGVRNNVFGTLNVARLANEFGCTRFVMVSTDKAVSPTNVMGASKRIAEIFCQNLNAHSPVRFITVRFGNVLASAGSVVPLFRQQIANGGPVTVTHPDITRYFMTIQEAVGLTLQASVMGKGGEIFVLNMGEPVKIKALADLMIRLAGKKPDVDIPIIYTGLRPGEKLHEEMFHEEEALRNTTHAKVMLAKSRVMDMAWLEEQLILLEKATRAGDKDLLMNQLKVLVPEFASEFFQTDPSRDGSEE